MKPFTSESQRYEYPLTPEHLVIDAGGYRGDFADEIFKRYGCSIEIFEPVRRFYEPLQLRFAHEKKINVNPCGLGGSDCIGGKKVQFHVQNDSTGAFAGSPDVEEVELFPASLPFVLFPISAGLMKLNVEGMEFDILEDLIANNCLPNVQHLQVQWHFIVPDAQARYDRIRESLLKTHEHVWGENPQIWQSYSLRR